MRKISGSIPVVVIVILHCLDTFDCPVALGSTYPATHMSTTDISGGVKEAGACG